MTPTDKWICSCDNCEEPAAYSIVFRDEARHIHCCTAHAAELNKATNIESMVELPCPYVHGGVWHGTRDELL